MDSLYQEMPSYEFSLHDQQQQQQQRAGPGGAAAAAGDKETMTPFGQSFLTHKGKCMCAIDPHETS